MIGITGHNRVNHISINHPIIVKTPSSVIVEVDGYREVFTDAHSYNTINDSTEFDFITYYNMYGFMIDHQIKITTFTEKNERK